MPRLAICSSHSRIRSQTWVRWARPIGARRPVRCDLEVRVEVGDAAALDDRRDLVTQVLATEPGVAERRARDTRPA